jgi:hypothetical protein
LYGGGRALGGRSWYWEYVDTPNHISPKEYLALTPTLWGVIQNMVCAILKRPVYFERISYCCHHQLMIFGNYNVQLISIGLEW